jgi:hypothetical protein
MMTAKFYDVADEDITRLFADMVPPPATRARSIALRYVEA